MSSFAEIASRHGASLLVQYGSTVSGPTHEASGTSADLTDLPRYLDAVRRFIER